jgi:hypothetical protein
MPQAALRNGAGKRDTTAARHYIRPNKAGSVERLPSLVFHHTE